jgi:hypothetical protein
MSFITSATGVECPVELDCISKLIAVCSWLASWEGDKKGSNETCFVVLEGLDCEALFWLNLKMVDGSCGSLTTGNERGCV